MKHLFPAPDMKRGTHAHEENRAWKALTQAPWAAQIQGNKCCHLFHLCTHETGVLTSSACIRLTSKLTAAAWSPVTQSSPWVPSRHSEARGGSSCTGSCFNHLQRTAVRCVERGKVGYRSAGSPWVPVSRQQATAPSPKSKVNMINQT